MVAWAHRKRTRIGEFVMTSYTDSRLKMADHFGGRRPGQRKTPSVEDRRYLHRAKIAVAVAGVPPKVGRFAWGTMPNTSQR